MLAKPRALLLALAIAAPLVCAPVLAFALGAHADGVVADDEDAAQSLEVGGGAIDLVLEETPPGLPREAIDAWIGRAARALTGFYGRFPVERVRIEVGAAGAGRAIHGTTYSGRRIRIRLGAAVREADLADDWTLTHEMFHLAFPDLDREHLWMEEGLATYFEPIARARAGDLAPERVWADLVDGLPKGEPKTGDEGLDRTPTWGRTYWGGAHFWLMADLAIREATHDRHSADDALRAILAEGGDGAAHWEIERVLEAGDRATGTTALSDLYARLAEKPSADDLATLWKRLGVVPAGRGRVRFDDAAPLAGLRRAITDDGVR